MAIITDAGSGIGRATAILFAKEGAKVVVADINTSSGSETASQISENNGEAAISISGIVCLFFVKERLESISVDQIWIRKNIH